MTEPATQDRSGAPAAPRVVLGVTGGIAAYKACEVLRRLAESGCDVTVVATQSALRMVGRPTWEALSGHPVATDVWTDAAEVPHVRLGRAADLVVVAPATADTLARAAAGRADDLLTATLLTATCPVLFCPAMHTEMWQHPATVDNVALLRRRGAVVLDPAVGRLTGADSGAGRLPEPAEIVAAARALLDLGGVPRDLAGRRVLVTAGGTREALDPVRFLGNRSSGKQGHAVARAAALRGAEVVLVTAAPGPYPSGVEVVGVGDARALGQAVAERAPACDAVVMAAAVADFRPVAASATKLKKTAGAPVLELVENPDILAGLVRDRRPGQLVIGFAAETGDAGGSVLDHARAKLARKGCDLLVVNEVGEGLGFETDTNAVWLLAADGSATTVARASKDVIAHRLWDAVVPRLP